jgi:protease II
MEGRVGAGPEAARHAAKWRQAGATHLTVDTMRAGHDGVAGHLRALEQTAEALGLQ